MAAEARPNDTIVIPDDAKNGFDEKMSGTCIVGWLGILPLRVLIEMTKIPHFRAKAPGGYWDLYNKCLHTIGQVFLGHGDDMFVLVSTDGTFYTTTKIQSRRSSIVKIEDLSEHYRDVPKFFCLENEQNLSVGDRKIFSELSAVKRIRDERLESWQKHDTTSVMIRKAVKEIGETFEFPAETLILEPSPGVYVLFFGSFTQPRYMRCG